MDGFCLGYFLPEQNNSLNHQFEYALYHLLSSFWWCWWRVSHFRELNFLHINDLIMRTLPYYGWFFSNRCDRCKTEISQMKTWKYKIIRTWEKNRRKTKKCDDFRWTWKRESGHEAWSRQARNVILLFNTIRTDIDNKDDNPNRLLPMSHIRLKEGQV